MDCDNSTAINYRSACLGNDLAPVGRRPMDLQGTFGLVIPAFAETAALAVFLFVPFAAVHRSRMALLYGPAVRRKLDMTIWR
jgi:hypothetical protein